MDNNQLASVTSAIKESASVLVVLSPRVNFDGIAAGVSLYLSLNKANKQARIVSSEPIPVKYSSLVGFDQVENKIGGRNLVVSFDYTEDSIEKVSYQIENGKFNLMIQPKEGFTALDSDKVAYSYAGGKADSVFIIGFNSLEELGKLYQDNRAMFDQEKVFKFSYIPNYSFCEKISAIIHDLQLPLDPDISSNLMAGLERSTRGFDPASTSADTFETAAYLLRSGARRSGRPVIQARSEQIRPVVPAEQTTDEQQTPQEWLEPKIYKSNNTRS